MVGNIGYSLRFHYEFFFLQLNFSLIVTVVKLNIYKVYLVFVVFFGLVLK